MTHKAVKILLVFSNQLSDDDAIEEKLHYFQHVMAQLNAKNPIKPEYFLLYVGSTIPSYALLSQEIVQYALNETQRDKQILRSLGKTLQIPLTHQFTESGQADLQALHLAKELKMDKVLGFSKGFLMLHNFWKHVSHWFMLHGETKGHSKRATKAI